MKPKPAYSEDVNDWKIEKIKPPYYEEKKDRGGNKMKLPYYEDVKDWGIDRYLQSIDKKNISYKTWKTGGIYTQEGASCVGCASAMLLASEPNAIESKNIPSPEAILEESKKFDKVEKVGTDMKSGLKALEKMGFVKSYYYSDKIDEILISVLNLGPVVIGVDWYYGMQHCSGILKKTGGLLGQHAVVVYGVDLKKGYFLVVNSHGEDWGKDGKGKIGFALMNEIFKYGWAIEKNI